MFLTVERGENLAVQNKPAFSITRQIRNKRCLEIVYENHIDMYLVLFQKQVLQFIPEPKYNEAKLYCAYEQFDDESKNLLYENNDQHVQLSVTYVSDPYEKMVNISQVQVSKHLEN